MSRRVVLLASALISLPLLLSACGSSTSATPATPQAAVESVYHQAVSTASSYHVVYTVSSSHTGKNDITLTTVGNVYDSPKPTSSYESMTITAAEPGHSNVGGLLVRVDKGTLFMNADGFKMSGIKKIPGWSSISLNSYRQDITRGISSAFTPVVPIHQSKLLGSLLKAGKFVSSGTTTVAGHQVHTYAVTLTTSKFSNAAYGTEAIDLSRALELFSVKTPVTFTVDIGSGNRLALVGAAFTGTIFGVSLDTAITIQYTNYGATFSVTAPKQAKPVSNLTTL